jgi:small-conductance mechanosensitive channel
MSLENILTVATKFVPLIVTIIVAIVVLLIVDKSLRYRWRDTPGAQYRLQLILLVLTLASLVAVVVALPIKDALRGQLLSLLGILLSAAIALSATTFIGNIMAGIMLKAIRNARPGDFVTVADLTGRITEMDLLHTEVQTEFRDLVTIPNLYLVTQPVHVVRASGTIISAEVSLGYDVPRGTVADLLCQAAADSGLKDAFVHVRELGDFSILYRVAGLLEDVTSLISARSRLREAMLDALHAANIEIVSPSFMNSRVYPVEREFIPAPSRKARAAEQAQAEAVVFDKASDVASVEEIRKSVELIDRELAALVEQRVEKDDARFARLEADKARLQALLVAEEKRLRDAEIAEDG